MDTVRALAAQSQGRKLAGGTLLAARFVITVSLTNFSGRCLVKNAVVTEHFNEKGRARLSTQTSCVLGAASRLHFSLASVAGARFGLLGVPPQALSGGRGRLQNDRAPGILITG